MTQSISLSPVEVSHLPWSVLGNRALPQHPRVSQRQPRYSDQSEFTKKGIDYFEDGCDGLHEPKVMTAC